MTTIDSFSLLADEQLLERVQTLAGDERRATVALIAALAELDGRRLYLREGFSSLFTYCTQVLHLSEHAAYGRIEAARAARKFPSLLERLADGDITLTSLCLLAPHLTAENYPEVLAAARHKTKREVELLMATLRPQPPVPATVRKLPAPTATPTATDGNLFGTPEEPDQGKAAATIDVKRRAASVTPLAPERYKLQLTLSAETQDKLRRAQDLLRHVVPNGDLGVIVDRALTLLVRELERARFAETTRPRKATVQSARSRHIPAEIRRRVWHRDGGRCALMGTEGRCTERGFLEFHHVLPYADGGESVVENLELRCRAHNAYEAARWDGTLFTRESRFDSGYSVQTENLLSIRPHADPR
jgi:5-methylcytosine-specific restriction endonuclease McrA